MLTLIRASDALPEDIERLAAQASGEGYDHVSRLISEWRDGVERFTAEGCVLLCGFASDAAGQPQLVSVGGLTENFDPLTPALRMRRFYVAPEHRRKGYGRMIATALIQEASAAGQRVVLWTGGEGATLFWESLGFVREQAAHHTHALRLD